MTRLLFTIIGLLSLSSFSNATFHESFNKDKENKSKPNEKITVLIKWFLPESLKEISGICWLDEQRIACVQDELGVIFIYNILTAKIEKQIQFADPGDFESITKADNIYYVMRSDGQLFEINISSKGVVVKQYDIPYIETQDLEGVFYDKTKKRLLITIKNSDPKTSAKIKGIYSFDLLTKKISNNPVYEIDLSNPLIYKSDNDDDKKKNNEKEFNKIFFPSDIAVHPITAEIYILDGVNSSLLIIDKKGKMKSYIKLDKEDFPQPEGITFSSKGEMYISTEGSNKSGVIARVTIETKT